MVAYIEAHHDGLVVQNPLRRYDIPWSDIVKVTPGYYGIAIERHSSATVRAWAVQKSNWAAFRNWETRADRVAHEIARRARKGGAQRSSRSMLPSARERASLSRAKGRLIIVGLSAVAAVTIIRIVSSRF